MEVDLLWLISITETTFRRFRVELRAIGFPSEVEMISRTKAVDERRRGYYRQHR